MKVFYADASALFKLIWRERESGALKAFLGDAGMVSSELALTEIPRALHRTAAEYEVPVEPLLERAARLLDLAALRPVETQLLELAGTLLEPALRTLDAVHVATALYLDPIDGFVTYDVRQGAAARLAGLRTIAPGL